MSVENIKGNLLDFPNGINLICHIANCQNTMTTGASGIARQIADRYPKAAEADNEAFKAGEARLGLISYAEVEPGKKVVNLYGQEFYGTDKRYLDYEAFYVCLEALKNLLENAHKEGRVYTLGLPYLMGCNRAGGNWAVCETIVQSLFAGSPIKCYIVELPSTS